jgi:hypothetical protein
VHTKKLDIILNSVVVANLSPECEDVYDAMLMYRDNSRDVPVFEFNESGLFAGDDFNALKDVYSEELAAQGLSYKLPYPMMILVCPAPFHPMNTAFYFLYEKLSGEIAVSTLVYAKSKSSGDYIIEIDPYFSVFSIAPSGNVLMYISSSVHPDGLETNELTAEDFLAMPKNTDAERDAYLEVYHKNSSLRLFHIDQIIGFIFSMDKGIVTEKTVRGKDNPGRLTRQGVPCRVIYKVLKLCVVKKKTDKDVAISITYQKFDYRRGHWRHFAQPTKEGKMQTWIPSYAAGDIRLGIIVKDYTVSDDVMAQAVLVGVK